MQNAPGRHYREGISLIELFELFPNESAAETWFENERLGRIGYVLPSLWRHRPHQAYYIPQADALLVW